MPVETEWDDGTLTLIRYYFGKTWTLEELHAALERGNVLMGQVSHPVDTFFDFSDSNFIPPQMLPSLHQVQQHTPDNLRFSIAFGTNKFLMMLIQVVQGIAPGLMRNFRLVRTRAEALKLLAELRAGAPGQR